MNCCHIPFQNSINKPTAIITSGWSPLTGFLTCILPFDDGTHNPNGVRAILRGSFQMTPPISPTPSPTVSEESARKGRLRHNNSSSLPNPDTLYVCFYFDSHSITSAQHKRTHLRPTTEKELQCSSSVSAFSISIMVLSLNSKTGLLRFLRQTFGGFIKLHSPQ